MNELTVWLPNDYHSELRDVIVRTCQVCGYVWYERPLDDIAVPAEAMAS